MARVAKVKFFWVLTSQNKNKITAIGLQGDRCGLGGFPGIIIEAILPELAAGGYRFA